MNSVAASRRGLPGPLSGPYEKGNRRFFKVFATKQAGWPVKLFKKLTEM